jgi:AraC-like DNA-binding protein
MSEARAGSGPVAKPAGQSFRGLAGRSGSLRPKLELASISVLPPFRPCLAEAKRYFDAHLADPDLSPADVAEAVGVSLRNLHRLFEPTGTSFARYGLRQRLIRCRDAIAGATGTGRSIADVAFGWAFAVRHAEYGVKPGDYDTVRDALVWMFEQPLGDGFTPAAKNAWDVRYDGPTAEMTGAVRAS